MNKKFRDELVENIRGTVGSLNTLLTTEGSIVDVLEVSSNLIERCSDLMCDLQDYSEVLRAREVD